MKMTEKAREARARRALRWYGLLVRKSRVISPNLDDLGGYMLVNDRNWIVAGSRHELTLDDLEARATEEVEGELEALAERVREMQRAARATESAARPVGMQDPKGGLGNDFVR